MNSVVLEHLLSRVLQKQHDDTISLVANGMDFHSSFQYFHYSINHRLQVITSQYFLPTLATSLPVEKAWQNIFYLFEIKLERAFFTSSDVSSLPSL